MRHPSKTVRSVLALIALCCLAPCGRAESIFDVVERGRQALIAEKPAEASAHFGQALGMAEFTGLNPEAKRLVFILASYAAEGTKDNLSAHDFLIAATQDAGADSDTWMRRAHVACVVENWADAALALTTVARRWPKAIKHDRYHAWLVGTVANRVGREPRLHQNRLDMLNALFDADYKGAQDSEPSHLWLVLATEAVERGDIARARVIARRIETSSVLVALLIDKRFDALTSAKPQLFDVRAAAERQARRLRKSMANNPKTLGVMTQYGYALYTLGRFDEMVSLADATIATVEKAPADAPAYEDLDDQLNWIHNLKANALRALGRWDEAAEVLAAWERHPANRNDKASQAINLGYFYNELARPEDALRAIEGIDWTQDMSDYGRTQLQYVRFQALQQLGKKDEVRDIVAWMREHGDVAPNTLQCTLVEAGDTDGAAALLLSRLRDADKRSAALAEIQHYEQPPATDRQKSLHALIESLLARSDVAAAIDQYGRRKSFPIYSLEY